MRKIRNFLLYMMVIISTVSCASAKDLYSVRFDKSLEQVQIDAELMEKDKSYQKKFTAKDEMGNYHTVIIYDDEYMKIDKVFYAYKFNNLMYYGLSLNVMGDIRTVDGSEKVWGMQGYATAINNPETTISFIFCKDMYPKRFSSMYEARQINGVSFAGLNKDAGYVDDFGCWQTYDWKDYFGKVFNTMNKDVKMKMFISIAQSGK